MIFIYFSLQIFIKQTFYRKNKHYHLDFLTLIEGPFRPAFGSN